MLQCCPCGNLDVHNDPVRCGIARSFPADCPGCAAYVAGQTAEERTRMDAWQPALDQMAAPSRGEIADSIEFVEQRIDRKIEEIKAELKRQDQAIQELARRLAHLAREIQKNTLCAEQ
jgi:hypothetical protein